MIMVMEKDGHIHVHAPFEQRYVMNQFVIELDKQVKMHVK